MIFRKQYTMPIPPGAQITERDGKHVARWRLRNGQVRTGEIGDGKDGTPRLGRATRAHVARHRQRHGRAAARTGLPPPPGTAKRRQRGGTKHTTEPARKEFLNIASMIDSCPFRPHSGKRGRETWTDKAIPEATPRQPFAAHHHNPVITFDSRLQGRSDRMSAF